VRSVQHSMRARPNAVTDVMVITAAVAIVKATSIFRLSRRVVFTWFVLERVLMMLLVLAFELEVTSYMTLNNVGRDAMVVPDELVGQPGTGKVGLRLRKDRLFRPSVHRD
jgi:hypothetical protein